MQGLENLSLWLRLNSLEPIWTRSDVSLKQTDKHVKFSQNNLVRIHVKALDQIQAYLSEEREEMRQKLNPSFSPSSPTHQEIQTSARILDREIKHLGEFNNIYRVTNKTETVKTTQTLKISIFGFCSCVFWWFTTEISKF